MPALYADSYVVGAAAIERAEQAVDAVQPYAIATGYHLEGGAQRTVGCRRPATRARTRTLSPPHTHRGPFNCTTGRLTPSTAADMRLTTQTAPAQFTR